MNFDKNCKDTLDSNNIHLTYLELANKSAWKNAGIQIPTFDIKKVTKDTKAKPTWIHFGAGNIFRAFPAALQQKLLDSGIENTGIIVAEGYDYEIIDKLFVPHDNLSLLVTLKADGSTEKTVISSVVESLKVDSQNENDFSRLKEIFQSKSLQMVSFTITEKGYSLVNNNGEPLSDVYEDYEKGPKQPKSYIGKLVALCYERYLSNKLPLALVSMDNCSHNGTKLYEAVFAFAKVWEDNKLVEVGFCDYIKNPDKISFPWTMIDKITPRPDDDVKIMLNNCGFADVEGQVTTKNTFIAPFVNAEETEWLIIEDNFPNGRPKLEQAGVIFTTRETVDKVEKMKVCTCLNPLHTALAIFGCLLGYKKISDEMKDVDLLKLIERIGYVEGLPVVVDPEIIDPKAFIDNVLKVRLPNPFIPDTPQRIATDTSQKLSIRFGETIKAYINSDTLDVKDLKAIPLVLAAWCRYLQGIDDFGNKFDISPDPMLSSLVGKLDNLPSILSDEKIFGVNLYDVGLGEHVEALVTAMSSGVGSVRSALQVL